MIIIDILKSLAIFCWLSFTIFSLIGVYALLSYKPKYSIKKAKNVEFVLISIASKSVKASLFESLDDLIQRFDSEYSIHILINEDAELKEEIKEKIAPYKNTDIIEVPSTYNQNLIGKGRAISYFINKIVKTREQNWFVFLDDDNLILDDKFLYEIPYYEKKGYVVANPILVPRKGKSTFTFIADWIRYFDDLMLFKFFTGVLKRPLLGLHGELLTAKGEFLKNSKSYEIKSITEDFVFASEVVSRKKLSWQSATKVSIKSPNSIWDFFKQRGRWYHGISKYIIKTNPEMKFFVIWRFILWNLSWLSGWLVFPLWLLIFKFPIWMSLAFWPGAGYFWASYIYGVYKSGKYWAVFIIPLFSITENMSIFMSRNHKKFEVINKN